MIYKIGLAAAVLLSSLNGFCLAAEVHMTIKGLKSTKGQVGILLFNQPTGFPGEENQSFKHQWVSPALEDVHAQFIEVPPGIYAVSVLHDENANGKMDYNFVGAPKEGHGASKNPRPAMRAPRFKEAQFDVKDPQTTTEIKMIY